MPILNYEVDQGLLRGIRVAAALEDIPQGDWIRRELANAVVANMGKRMESVQAKGEVNGATT